MLWFARIAEKFDLPGALLYKVADPETLRKLRRIKERVRQEKDQIKYKVTLDPRVQEFLNTHGNQPPQSTGPSVIDVRTASVSFSIYDSHKISQPKTILSLTYPMIDAIKKNCPPEIFDPNPTNIVPDGDDWNKFVGTMNIYIDSKKGQNPEAVIPYVQQALETEFEPLGIQGQVREVNMSKMTGDQAIRVEFTANETTDLEQFPRMNISNGNYFFLNRLLQLSGDDDWSGSISARDLLSRISMARRNVDQHTRPPENRGGFLDPGLDADQLTQYLDNLEQLANRAIQMNNDTITWG